MRQDSNAFASALDSVVAKIAELSNLFCGVEFWHYGSSSRTSETIPNDIDIAVIAPSVWEAQATAERLRHVFTGARFQRVGHYSKAHSPGAQTPSVHFLIGSTSQIERLPAMNKSISTGRRLNNHQPGSGHALPACPILSVRRNNLKLQWL